MSLTRESASARRRCGSGFVGSSSTILRKTSIASGSRCWRWQARRDLVERGERVARQPELLIELGELRRDVPVALLELRDVLRDDLADLLVDRDRLEREALRRVVACRRARRSRWRRRSASIFDWRSPILSSVRASFGSLSISFWYSRTALSYFFFSTNFWAASSTLSRSIATDYGTPIGTDACASGRAADVDGQGTSNCLRTTHATDKKAAARRAPTRIAPLRPACILPAATFLAFAPITWCSAMTMITR